MVTKDCKKCGESLPNKNIHLTNWGERMIFHPDGTIEITNIPKEALDERGYKLKIRLTGMAGIGKNCMTKT